MSTTTMTISTVTLFTKLFILLLISDITNIITLNKYPGNILPLASATFGSKGMMTNGYNGGGGSGGDIELCQCPDIPAPIKYVAVEVPKPVRVTSMPAPTANQGPPMIPIVLPDKDEDSENGDGGGGGGYGD